MMALARSAADRSQTARLRELFGNPTLDADGAADLREIIQATGARDRIEQMIRVRTEAALTALRSAAVGEEARAALVALAAQAIDRRA
jgi:geranylgeranyl pyrophosphate synthase